MEGPQPGLPEAKRGCNLRRETCNVRYSSLLRLRLRCPFCQSARRWLSGQKGVFPRERSDLQGKCDSSGGKPPRTKVLWLSHGTFREIRDFGTSLQPERVGATKERYPDLRKQIDGRSSVRGTGLQPAGIAGIYKSGESI